MKIIVATDSYKGTVSAPDATGIIADALADKLPLAQILRMPIADGGEGSAECLVSACGGGFAVTTVKNCFFEDTQVRIGLIGEGDTAIVELAEAAGLRYAEGRANPMFTTTYGVGQMIRTAASLGVRRILLCLGGSATNDLGLGAAAALGVRFFDAAGEEMLPLGGTLDEVAAVDLSLVPDDVRALEFVCLCDVRGTLTGADGAARMFAPQKGATPEMVAALEAGAAHMQALFDRELGVDVSALAGGAAAGGFAAGFAALFGAEIRSGIGEVLHATGFDREIETADAVITGEGRFDRQSVCGKAIGGVIEAANRFGVPVFVLAGSVGDAEGSGAAAVFSTVRDFCSFADIRTEAKQYLRAAAESLAAAVALGAGSGGR